MIKQLAKWLMKLGLRLITVFSLLAVTACASEGVRPPARESVATPETNALPAIETFDPTASGGMPAHLLEEPVRVAIMLPLTGEQAELGKALLGAASMALFDAYDPRITLIPFDTRATMEGAGLATEAVLAADVDVVLGPLFSDSIKVAGPALAEANLTMIGFSSDRRVAGPGQFIMGFAPEDEVKRVMRYAITEGHSKFAALIPKGLYGRRVSEALGTVLEETNTRMMALEEYPPSADAVFEPVKRLANYAARKRMRDEELRAMKEIDSDVSVDIIKELEKIEVLDEVNFTAVLVPEGGQLLRTIAPLLP